MTHRSPEIGPATPPAPLTYRIRERRAPAAPGSQSGKQAVDQPPAQQPEAYKVGYGKPPKSGRFKPGQSGNPKGRPKAAKDIKTLIRENLNQKISVRTPQGDKKIRRIEALIQVLCDQAFKGNQRAIADLVKLYSEAVPEIPSQVQQEGRDNPKREEDLTATDLAIIEAFLKQVEGDLS